MKQGFTLIEVLIYLALFSIIIFGAIVTTITIIDSTRKSEDKVALQEEANFLLRKIDWALSGVSAINQPFPPPAKSNTSFCVTKLNFPSNPIKIYVESNDVFIRMGDCGNGGTFFQLNSDNLSIASSTFEHFAAAGTKPEALRAAFEFTNSNDYFETIKYLRK